MENIENFFIEKLKEKHIVNNIFKYYYEDWEEYKINVLKEDITNLRTQFCKSIKIFYTEERIKINKKLKKKEKELFLLKYNNIKKFENIGKEIKKY